MPPTSQAGARHSRHRLCDGKASSSRDQESVGEIYEGPPQDVPLSSAGSDKGIGSGEPSVLFIVTPPESSRVWHSLARCKEVNEEANGERQ